MPGEELKEARIKVLSRLLREDPELCGRVLNLARQEFVKRKETDQDWIFTEDHAAW